MPTKKLDKKYSKNISTSDLERELNSNNSAFNTIFKNLNAEKGRNNHLKNKNELVRQLLNNTDKIIIGYYNSSFYIDMPIFKLINYHILNNSNENTNILLLLKNVVINSLLLLPHYHL